MASKPTSGDEIILCTLSEKDKDKEVKTLEQIIGHDNNFSNKQIYFAIPLSNKEQIDDFLKNHKDCVLFQLPKSKKKFNCLNKINSFEILLEDEQKDLNYIDSQYLHVKSSNPSFISYYILNNELISKDTIVSSLKSNSIGFLTFDNSSNPSKKPTTVKFSIQEGEKTFEIPIYDGMRMNDIEVILSNIWPSFEDNDLVFKSENKIIDNIEDIISSENVSVEIALQDFTIKVIARKTRNHQIPMNPRKKVQDLLCKINELEPDTLTKPFKLMSNGTNYVEKPETLLKDIDVTMYLNYVRQ
ncbi:hypothetical protein TVAG_419620 [Trichomonas vaginalis G3]|uniref:Uncharacterized protein n=1 Tax=Trichomonas vaginalis (strain ATCC PRA-98 / G3) TaxID=412133 RepID=A2EIT6_TRIV3|nr:hypothetical protein TVAGG3_0913860 [Trichomonas vaginalis G3]EAY07420.1 hypothetical protein TVAG_419620 [Trichomonas vaginalis G3]KAI5484630.1 hypothetical protein TVAGG3_0913860 [Trichomonas vaginalis G3]|eukprot:XP_001319643.1 hypothetical protein [Trichomonas vaginalis G3]